MANRSGIPLIKKILKKHAKTEANKLVRETTKIENKKLMEHKITRINNDGENIYDTILGWGYIDNEETVNNFLDDKVPSQYDSGVLSTLQKIIDFMAINNVFLNKRLNPCKLIENIYSISIQVSINQRSKYYKKELFLRYCSNHFTKILSKLSCIFWL